MRQVEWQLDDDASVAVQKSAFMVAASPRCGLLNQSHTRFNKLLVSFDSEVRIRPCRKLRRTSESGHWRRTVNLAFGKCMSDDPAASGLQMFRLSTASYRPRERIDAWRGAFGRDVL